MKVIGKDRTSCDVCNPIDEILARLDALERRASAIVAKVQGIAPDGEGNVTLPTSSSDTDPLHGRVDAFAMSSEVKEAADDAHAYAASIADDVIVINSEIVALNQAVEALQPAEIEAIKSAVQTLQTTVATLESTVATLNNSVAGKVSKSGDTMSGLLHLTGGFLLSTTPDKAVTDVPIFSTMREIDVSSVNAYQVAGSINMHWSGWKYSGGMINWRDASHTTTDIISESKSGSQTRLSVWQPNDGSAGFITYPSWSPGTNDNSDKILTIKMANSLPSLVHTTGNESISGDKTFKGHMFLDYNNGSVQFDTIVTTTKEMYGISSYNNTSNIHTLRTPQGTVIRFNCRNKNSRWISLDIINPDNSDPYCEIPSTPSTANGKEIATAEWVLARINELATKNGLNGL